MVLAADPVFARHRRWRLLDEAGAVAAGDVAEQLAADLALLAAVGQGGALPTLRLWRHRRALVLGYRDTRLPGWQTAAEARRQAGWSLAVRASGGAAVPLDAGVLNLALVYPTAEFSVDQGFAAMHALIGTLCARIGLKAAPGLVTGGYCPGESDLAIDGRKFAGVSQRRQKWATLVHAFLLVEGSGAARARRAAAFYQQAAGGAPPTAYPQVRPEAMAALRQLRGGAGSTVAAVRRQLAALLPS